MERFPEQPEEPRGVWGRLVGGHNPFYLLSAFSMLLGCLTLSRALALEPGHAGKLVLLLGVLNVYETLLIGLALFLIVRRGLVRDGRTLLWLESVFLVDTTFLASELYASDLGTGALVAAAVLILAVLKLGAIARVLHVRLGPALWFGLAPLGGLLAMPGAFAALAQAYLLTPPIVYLLWWVLALLIVAQAIVERQWPEGPLASPAEKGAAALRQAFRALPSASLALHLIGAGWVQGLDFYPSLLGPALVALGIRRVLNDAPSMPSKGSFWWPAWAILLSAGAPSEFLVTGVGGLVLSPLRLAIVTAGLAYLLAARIHRSRAFAWGAGLCLLAAPAGHSVLTIITTYVPLGLRALSFARTVLSWPGRLVPRTTGQWGVLTVALSFVLLALGARKSLRAPRVHGPAPRASRWPKDLTTTLPDSSEV